MCVCIYNSSLLLCGCYGIMYTSKGLYYIDVFGTRYCLCDAVRPCEGLVFMQGLIYLHQYFEGKTGGKAGLIGLYIQSPKGMITVGCVPPAKSAKLYSTTSYLNSVKATKSHAPQDT